VVRDDHGRGRMQIAHSDDPGHGANGQEFGAGLLRQDCRDKAEFTRQGQMQVTHSTVRGPRAHSAFSVFSVSSFLRHGQCPQSRNAGIVFSKLHQRGCFRFPIRDIGTAKYLCNIWVSKRLRPRRPGRVLARIIRWRVKRDDMLAHIKELSKLT